MISHLLPFSAQWSSMVRADLEEPIKLLEQWSPAKRFKCALNSSRGDRSLWTCISDFSFKAFIFCLKASFLDFALCIEDLEAAQ
jgi:hypothetical protein